MINWYAATQAITARVQTIPNIDVWEHDVPDGYQPATYGETIKPYAILAYAGIADTRETGISGPQDDSFPAMFSVHSVASTDADARYLNQQVFNLLVGWAPPSCSVIRPAFFAGIGAASQLSAPTRLVASQAYRLTVAQ